MSIPKKSCCAFLHFSEKNEIPYYVQIFCNELSNYFDEIVLVTNNFKLKLDESFSSNISLWFTENKGYDFGMFYRFTKKINFNDYKQIALVNDSNVLLTKLDSVFNWANNQDVDFWGMIDSHEKPWFSSHQDNFHIQSHFLVFNKTAMEELSNFFNSIDLHEIFNEKDLKKVRRMVINQWEIGLTQYFRSKQLNIDTFVHSEECLKKYKTKKKNLTISNYKELIINESYPLIKKKGINGKKAWYKMKDEGWKQFILDFGNKYWDLKRLITEFENF